MGWLSGVKGRLRRTIRKETNSIKIMLSCKGKITGYCRFLETWGWRTHTGLRLNGMLSKPRCYS